MEVQMISIESVKPSSQTPPDLRNYKLSFLNQSTTHVYCPIILFYSGPFHDHVKFADTLKRSLSRTLNYFYVWAGRVEDIFTINCNDEGADFIQARISNSTMAETIRNPQSHLLQKLLPFRHYNITLNELLSKPLVAVQINYFESDGGIAIGVCISHAVADGLSTATFLKSWAQVTQGISNTIDISHFDFTTLFPPQDNSAFTSQLIELIKESSSNMVLERFRLNSSNIAFLREKLVSKGPHLKNPSKYEAVTALLWGAVIDTTEKKNEKFSAHTLRMGMDLRRRMNPPLSENCIGTIVSSASTLWPAKKNIDYNSLAHKIREMITKVDHKFLRNISGNNLSETSEMLRDTRGAKFSYFVSSSWCRFPFNEVDFGWGKPVWLGYVPIMNNMALLLDSIDGEGIEAWVTLSKEDMETFKQNPDILASTSLISRI